MKSKKLAAAALAFVVTFPVITHADITVYNNTNAYSSGQLSSSPCSSIIGSRGVLGPKSSVNIPQVVFDMYCPTTCEVHVFMNKSCSGKKVATLQVDHEKGVMSIQNHGQYTLTGGGSILMING